MNEGNAIKGLALSWPLAALLWALIWWLGWHRQ